MSKLAFLVVLFSCGYTEVDPLCGSLLEITVLCTFVRDTCARHAHQFCSFTQVFVFALSGVGPSLVFSVSCLAETDWVLMTHICPPTILRQVCVIRVLGSTHRTCSVDRTVEQYGLDTMRNGSRASFAAVLCPCSCMCDQTWMHGQTTRICPSCSRTHTQSWELLKRSYTNLLSVYQPLRCVFRCRIRECLRWFR